MMKPFIYSFFLIVGLWGCDPENVWPTENAQLGDTIEINLNHSLRIGFEDALLTFDSVLDDSRCPADMLCIWPGNASVLFTYKVDLATDAIELNTYGDHRFPREAELDGYKITLVDLLPYPSSNPSDEHPKARIIIVKE